MNAQEKLIMFGRQLNPFLEANGFTPLQIHKDIVYTGNSVCNIIIEDDCYHIYQTSVLLHNPTNNPSGLDSYSKDHNIYWLAGYLSWYGIIKRGYCRDMDDIKTFIPDVDKYEF